MTYLPTKEELKELKFIKKRDTGVYERKISKVITLCFDYEIELDDKFYALYWTEDEELLAFEDKEEFLLFIKELEWEKY